MELDTKKSIIFRIVRIGYTVITDWIFFPENRNKHVMAAQQGTAGIQAVSDVYKTD